MSAQLRSERIKKIKSDIEKYGLSVTVVAPGPLPRLAYTIGLQRTLGFELAMPGACFFTSREVHAILNEFGAALIADSEVERVEVRQCGSFTLRAAHPSWSRILALGAFDYFGVDALSVAQVVPDVDHMTSDVPDASRILRPESEPAWRWISEPWDLPVSETAMATTNIASMRGQKITELTRWGNDEWEMFSGAGPDVSIEDVRVVPIGVLIGIDPSLKVAFDASTGEGYWRHDAVSEWHEWKPKS